MKSLRTCQPARNQLSGPSSRQLGSPTTPRPSPCVRHAVQPSTNSSNNNSDVTSTPAAAPPKVQQPQRSDSGDQSSTSSPSARSVHHEVYLEEIGALSEPLRTYRVLENGQSEILNSDGTVHDDEKPTTSYTSSVDEELLNSVPNQFHPWLLAAASYCLPSGYPKSVSPDYLQYQLWALPTHVVGSISFALTTSSMLKALGFSVGASSAVALGASAKWLLKDGVGSVGRFIVGGRLSRNFDSDPKYWRFVAELIATTGIALEILTAAFPQYFLLLAGSGTLAKAVSKAIGKPCFRVIQSHFSSVGFNNIGDVTAKEEVWEVVGRMVGLAIGVSLINTFETEKNPSALLETWVFIQSIHVWLRYKTLSSLQLRTVNHKRAVALIDAYVNEKRVLSFEETGKRENILVPPEWVRPYMNYCAISELISANSASPVTLSQLLDIYKEENFLLVWRDGKAYVSLAEKASGVDVLKCIALSYTLDRQLNTDGNETANAKDIVADLTTALKEVNGWLPDFAKAVEAAGWDISIGNVVIALGGTRYKKLALESYDW